MNVAELFVELGLVGNDKTKSGLKETDNSLKSVWSTGLAAKAAILGAAYGLEQMMSKSMNFGNDIASTSILIGMSTKRLQEFRGAGILAGAAAEDVSQSLKNIHNIMGGLYLGKDPGMLGFLKSKLKNFNIAEAVKDPGYALQQLQELAQNKSISQSVLNKVFQNFGVGEGTEVAAIKNAFTDKNFKKVPIVSDSMIEQLRQSKIDWERLSQRIDLAFANFTSKHGKQLIHDLGDISTSLITMIGLLDDLASKVGVFTAISTALSQVKESGISGTKDLPADIKSGKMLNAVMDVWKAIPAHRLSEYIQGKIFHTTVHQTITHHGDAKDTRAVGNTHKAAARSSHALNQSN